MSAFLASQQTYDYIASGLYDAAIRHDSEHHYTVRQFLDIDRDATDETLEHGITAAVCKLYDLNRLALVTRYGEQWERERIVFHRRLRVLRLSTLRNSLNASAVCCISAPNI